MYLRNLIFQIVKFRILDAYDQDPVLGEEVFGQFQPGIYHIEPIRVKTTVGIQSVPLQIEIFRIEAHRGAVPAHTLLPSPGPGPRGICIPIDLLHFRKAITCSLPLLILTSRPLFLPRSSIFPRNKIQSIQRKQR